MQNLLGLPPSLAPLPLPLPPLWPFLPVTGRAGKAWPALKVEATLSLGPAEVPATGCVTGVCMVEGVQSSFLRPRFLCRLKTTLPSSVAPPVPGVAAPRPLFFASFSLLGFHASFHCGHLGSAAHSLCALKSSPPQASV